MKKIFSLIYQGSIHTSSDQKIVPEGDYSLILSAEEVLQKAQEDAARKKQETEEECKELARQAKEEGFQEGLKSFNEHILGFEREIRRLRHEAQQAILPIALKAAKKIVAQELKLNPDAIVDIVLQAITPIVQSRKVIIYVNKADKEILDAQKSRLREILEQAQVFSIQERSDIEPGGCIIETETGIINATLDNQWRALEAAFEKYMRH